MNTAQSTASVLRLLADQLLHGTVIKLNIAWQCQHPEGNGAVMYPEPTPRDTPDGLSGFHKFSPNPGVQHDQGTIRRDAE